MSQMRFEEPSRKTEDTGAAGRPGAAGHRTAGRASYQVVLQIVVLGVLIVLSLPQVVDLFQDRGKRWAYILSYAFCFCYCLVPLTGLLAARWGAIDKPDARRIHEVATPRLGGIAIYVAFVLAIVVNGIFLKELTSILIGSTMIMALGVLDDTRGVSAQIRLLVQLLAVAVVVLGGVEVRLFPTTLTGYRVLNIFVTTVWIVGITNAVNFLDGMDGLAAGMGAIISFLMGLIAYQNQQADLAWVSMGILGGCLGFLPYNYRPGRRALVFLGDSGSTFLGYALACMALVGDWSEGSPLISLVAPLMLFSVPIYDMIHTTVTRIASGKVRSVRQWVEYVGRDHLHHRIDSLVKGRAQAVGIIYMLTGGIGMGAIILRRAGLFEACIVGFQGLVFLLLLTFLEYAGNKRQQEIALAGEEKQPSDS